MATGNQFIKPPTQKKSAPFGIAPPLSFEFKQPTFGGGQQPVFSSGQQPTFGVGQSFAPKAMYMPANQPDNRPSYSHMFMETCMLWRKRSTCQRIQTASVIVKNNNIISIGYNGVPIGQKHCSTFWQQFFSCAKGQTQSADPDLELFYQSAVNELGFNIAALGPIRTFEEFLGSDIFAKLHHYWSDKNELHAELNALLQAETNTHGATLYTLYSPCRQCAKSIISAKIAKVVYYEIYHRDTEGLDLLSRSGIIIEKIQ
jgi:dCMP deaminase